MIPDQKSSSKNVSLSRCVIPPAITLPGFHLNDQSTDTGIIQIGINYLLTNSCRSGIDNFISNIKKITEKCLVFVVNNAFVSRLVYTTRIDVPLLERVYVLILDFCRKSCFIYIDNRNTRSDSFYKDGLHLFDNRKSFLAVNSILYLNNNIFLKTHTHHPPKIVWVVILDKQLSFFKWEQNYIYYKGIGENV